MRNSILNRRARLNAAPAKPGLHSEIEPMYLPEVTSSEDPVNEKRLANLPGTVKQHRLANGLILPLDKVFKQQAWQHRGLAQLKADSMAVIRKRFRNCTFMAIIFAEFVLICA